MKIFAIQKTQTNTYSPQFKQDSRLGFPAQQPVANANQAGDKFVSKVSFGMAKIPDEISSKTPKELEELLIKLVEDLRLKNITQELYDETVDFIKRQQFLNGDFNSRVGSIDDTDIFIIN